MLGTMLYQCSEMLLPTNTAVPFLFYPVYQYSSDPSLQNNRLWANSFSSCLISQIQNLHPSHFCLPCDRNARKLKIIAVRIGLGFNGIIYNQHSIFIFYFLTHRSLPYTTRVGNLHNHYSITVLPYHG